MKRLLESRNQRLLRAIRPQVARINALEPAMQALNQEGLRQKTDEFRSRLKQGEQLEALLPEAFAVVREASARTLQLRPFDVQLVGGIVLHQGKIAEMCTGEGKTLVATLPAYLNALTGQGVHIITVNDYLAKRDAEWMRPVYELLGLSVGVVVSNSSQLDRQLAYQCDITFGTNNEFGFDYLRDNMIFRLEDSVQRVLHYAIIDEVDSILIDEARTPLIISGQTDEDPTVCLQMNQLVTQLKPANLDKQTGHYTLDEKTRQVHLTEEGHQYIEELMIKSGLLKSDDSLYDVHHIGLIHYLNAAMRAHFLYRRDVDYLVRSGEVIIIDEHTGRTMEGRRWSDGLHQAIETKEGVKIHSENQTLASITFQNYFRLYERIAGMTGTADTEAYEFQQIYGLEVVVIPTNRPLIRQDMPDQIYLSNAAKYRAVLADIKNRHEKGQPVLVGTVSIESSEYLSKQLKEATIPHKVLNAKYHEQEAAIIAEAGKPKAVTIATNMAGRGTDIVLGGSLQVEMNQTDPSGSGPDLDTLKADWQMRHDTVIQLGGLHVLGTERHESRRIDNQLRGRAGRQGDPGSSQFYLSLEDSLMRIFASEWVSGLMTKLGLQEDEVISHKLINRAVENAQRKVEGYNFDIRKQLLRYDDVINDQRKVIYTERHRLLEAEDMTADIKAMRYDVVELLVNETMPAASYPEQWDIEGLTQTLKEDFNSVMPIAAWLDEHSHLQPEDFHQKILTLLDSAYQTKIQAIQSPLLKQVERSLMLRILDMHWKDHLSTIDHLRQGIHLRGYAQKDPVQEFKQEAFMLFNEMLGIIKYEFISQLSHIRIDESAISDEDGAGSVFFNNQDTHSFSYQHPEAINVLSNHQTQQQANPSDPHHTTESQASSHATYVRGAAKVGRNSPCPCGSGKKIQALSWQRLVKQVLNK